MYLEIVSPEATLFSGEVDSVTVPGFNGEFQMLNNHAPIVTLLKEGFIKIHTHTQTHLVFDELPAAVVPHHDDDKLLTVEIKSGTIELKNNKLVILVD
jgi:F-type H+-transporting ATPase subunit epsilon